MLRFSPLVGAGVGSFSGEGRRRVSYVWHTGCITVRAGLVQLVGFGWPSICPADLGGRPGGGFRWSPDFIDGARPHVGNPLCKICWGREACKIIWGCGPGKQSLSVRPQYIAAAWTNFVLRGRTPMLSYRLCGPNIFSSQGSKCHLRAHCSLCEAAARSARGASPAQALSRQRASPAQSQKGGTTCK